MIHLFGTRVLCSVLLFFPCKNFFSPREEYSLISTIALRYFEIFFSYWLSHNPSSNTTLLVKAKIGEYWHGIGFSMTDPPAPSWRPQIPSDDVSERGCYLDPLVQIFQKQDPGLPWWLSGEETACQCRRHGLDPWSGKIPRATEQRSPGPIAMEPVLGREPGNATTEPAATTPENRAPESPCAQEKPTQREAPKPQLESSPPLSAAGEKPREQWRPSTAKSQYVN